MALNPNYPWRTRASGQIFIINCAMTGSICHFMQIYDVKQCQYGAITVTCDTNDCTLSYAPVTYNTFKYNIMILGTLLCNYVQMEDSQVGWLAGFE